MRHIMMLGLLVLVGGTGCQNVDGPFAPRRPMRVDDPRLPISEQERRGRDRLALPDITNGAPVDPSFVPDRGSGVLYK